MVADETTKQVKCEKGEESHRAEKGFHLAMNSDGEKNHIFVFTNMLLKNLALLSIISGGNTPQQY